MDVTPQNGASTQPVASAFVGTIVEERKVHVDLDLRDERIIHERKRFLSYNEREVSLDRW